MHEHQLCINTNNLKLNDNKIHQSNDHQIVDQTDRNLINLNTSSHQFLSPFPSTQTSFSSNQEFTSSNYPNNDEFTNLDNFNTSNLTSSPVLLINLDQTSQTTIQPPTKIKIEQVQNDTMNEDNQIDQTDQSINQSQRNATNISTKICKVCGDKSLGYNFSQVTCESCKAFFRRNALRNKNFKCPFTDNCEIDVVTRRFCQKCRLRKCFAIGMKSEWILSDEEKRLKRLKIEENKKKRRTKQLTSPTSTYIPSPYSMENNNYLNGSLQQSSNVTTTSNTANLPTTNNYLSPSLVPMPMNGLNPIVYDSQIDDSNNGFMMMQSSQSTSFYTQNHLNNNQDQQIQQPEIVNQLVQSHYEQYRTNLDYDPVNYESSPQYSTNHNPMASSIDQFFNDTSSTVTFNNSTNNGFGNSLSINALSMINDQNENSPTYSPDHNFSSSIQSNQPNISKFLTINCLPDNEMIDKIFEQAIISKLQSTTDPTVSTTPLNDNSFIANELELINELLFATSNVGCAMNALTHGDTIAPENVIFELLRMTDYAVRKSVKVAKKLYFFRSLCEEDQISALKGSSTEMMLCRTIGLYDEATDSIIKHEIAGKPKIRLNILKSIREEIYYEHKEMILSFKKELRQDTTLVSILMAILLFQPDRPMIQHRTSMKYIQTIYRFLLKRYIYINFSKENLPIYESLLLGLNKLRSLNEKYIKTYVQLNADIIGPLLMEVFDFA